MGHCLGGTEVLHILGDLDTHFFAKTEEVVNAVFTRHHHCLELIGADPVFAEFLLRDRLDMIKRSPVYLDSVFLLNVIVG